MSRHRSRPPCFGLHQLSKVRVVDNSEIGQQAMMSGKIPHIIHVYRKGFRKGHMPHAHLGDKVLLAIKGEMIKAWVVGYAMHPSEMKHGQARTDGNSVVLIDDDGNPLGTRITEPIPSCLRNKREAEFQKVLAIATKFL